MSCEDNSCGIGGWGGPLPGDPDNTTLVLSANPIGGGISISWNYPASNSHAVAHFLLFRGTKADFDEAAQIATVAGSFYEDKVLPGKTYFYWVRIVSINGTVGEHIGPVSSSARSFSEDLLEELSGKIDSGALSLALKTSIGSIIGISTNIAKEASDRIAANKVLADALAAVKSDLGVALTLVSNEITQRTEGDTALVDAINIIAAGSNNNAAAIIEEKRLRVTADSATAQQIDTMYTELNSSTNTKIAAAITSERIATVNREEAITTRIDTAFTQLGNASSAIQQESTTRSAEDIALGLRVDTVEANVGNNTAAIQTESSARATADGAASLRIDTVQASASDANTAASAAQSSANAAKIAADNAQSAANTANTELAAISSDNILSPGEKPSILLDYNVIQSERAGLISQATASGVTTQKTAYDNACTALTTYLNTSVAGWNVIPGVAITIVGSTLRTKFADVYLARQVLLNKIADVTKSVANDASTVANDAYTLASDTSAVVSNIEQTKIGYSVISGTSTPFDGDNVTTVYSTANYPAVSFPEYAANRKRIIDKIGVDNWNSTAAGVAKPLTWLIGLPLASAIKQVGVTDANGNFASLETAMIAQKDLNGNFKAQYTAKVDVNNLVGGFGIYNDGAVVEAGFNVDKFWVGRTGSNKVKPFIIDNNVVYIDKARIRSADIDTLKIAGNAVTVPTYLSGNGENNGINNIGTSSNIQFASVSLSYPDAVDILIVANWQSQLGTVGAKSGMRIYVDGNEVVSWSDSGVPSQTTSHVGTGKVHLSGGSHTITASVFNDYWEGTWDLKAWGLIFLGVMR